MGNKEKEKHDAVQEIDHKIKNLSSVINEVVFVNLSEDVGRFYEEVLGLGDGFTVLALSSGVAEFLGGVEKSVLVKILE